MNQHAFRQLPLVLLHHAIIACIVLSFALGTRSAVSFDDPIDKAQPSPKLTPQEVIQLQISALSAPGDVKDRVANCYEFASPANKRFTGPIGKFEQMIQSPEYCVLLDARTFLAGRAVAESPDLVHLMLTVIDRQGSLVCFRCFLSKQTVPKYRDCWMTDAVIRVGEVKLEERRQPDAKQDAPTI
jgi:hypothetical protein